MCWISLGVEVRLKMETYCGVFGDEHREETLCSLSEMSQYVMGDEDHRAETMG